MINILNALEGKNNSFKDNSLIYIVPFNVVRPIHNFTPHVNLKHMYNDILLKGRFVYKYDANKHNFMQQVILSVVIQNSKDKSFLVHQDNGVLSIFLSSYITENSNNIITSCLSHIMKDYKYKDLGLIGYSRNLLPQESNQVFEVFHAMVSTKRKNQIWMSYNEIIENFSSFNKQSKMIIDFMFINKKENSFGNKKILNMKEKTY